MLDWLIIGGGPHGRFVAAALRRAAPAAEVVVLDVQAALAAWQRRATACGMVYLRSSGAHHLGPRANDLRRFAAARGFDRRHMLGYYRRPSRALFEAHGHAVLDDLPTLNDHAAAIEPAGRGWRVHTRSGAAHRAVHVVLALGPNAPYRPRGAHDAAHVYDADFDADIGNSDERVAVVGGGITGAQLALRFAKAGQCICWVTRAAPQAADFDSDPCYAGRRCLDPFLRMPPHRRTALLASARQPGTLPPDIMARITAALAAGEIAWRRGDIELLDEAGLVFADGRRLDVDRVVLATGFCANPAPDSLLGRCVRDLELSLDHGGHVYLDRDLAATPGLHLTGRPASLQLGPMAGNIRGARLAGERLAALAATESAPVVRRA